MQHAGVAICPEKADQAAQTGYVTRKTCTKRSKIEPSKHLSVPDRRLLDKPLPRGLSRANELSGSVARNLSGFWVRHEASR
ncbi:hypothetical protein, partial [Burkholderia sp. BDU5]|uniref:hypothetical protein n=1 Tax=Burkholderia sp. BDU5 TaxID=1385590 RepID=UPI001E6093B6